MSNIPELVFPIVLRAMLILAQKTWQFSQLFLWASCVRAPRIIYATLQWTQEIGSVISPLPLMLNVFKSLT